ncbi:hypothetical protein DSUL_30085 [Desulfovibrionales bacterium]
MSVVKTIEIVYINTIPDYIIFFDIVTSNVDGCTVCRYLKENYSRLSIFRLFSSRLRVRQMVFFL